MYERNAMNHILQAVNKIQRETEWFNVISQREPEI